MGDPVGSGRPQWGEVWRARLNWGLGSLWGTGHHSSLKQECLPARVLCLELHGDTAMGQPAREPLKLLVTPRLLAGSALGREQGGEAAVQLSITAERRWEAEGGAVPPGGRGHLRGGSPASPCSRMAPRALPVPEAWPGQQPRLQPEPVSAGWLREGASQLGKEQAFPWSWQEKHPSPCLWQAAAPWQV